MKKILFAALAAVVSMSACSKQNKTEIDETVINETEEVSTPTETVVVLENDTIYSPAKTVDALTVLDFNATWCGPCKQFAPAFEEVAAKYPDVDFVSVDVDVNPATAQAFGIQGVPTVVLLKPDGSMKQYVGTDSLLPAEKFDAIVAAALK